MVAQSSWEDGIIFSVEEAAARGNLKVSQENFDRLCPRPGQTSLSTAALPGEFKGHFFRFSGHFRWISLPFFFSVIFVGMYVCARVTVLTAYVSLLVPRTQISFCTMSKCAKFHGDTSNC